LFFYCHDGSQASNTAISILKGLIDQSLHSNSSLVPICYARRITSNEPILRANTLAKKLLEDLCLMTPKTFIIIDGLDECDHAERRQVTSVLMDLVGLCNASDPGKLRVLLVSQYSPEIYKSLHSSAATSLRPGILKITEADNRSDIETYVAAWVVQIAQKFQLQSVELREYVHKVTVNNSKGMPSHLYRAVYCIHRKQECFCTRSWSCPICMTNQLVGHWRRQLERTFHQDLKMRELTIMPFYQIS
jgi:hypothetical protein